jgi:hypothetical protein
MTDKDRWYIKMKLKIAALRGMARGLNSSEENLDRLEEKLEETKPETS